MLASFRGSVGMGKKEDESRSAFGLQDFTMLWPIVAWRALKLMNGLISLIFQNLFPAA